MTDKRFKTASPKLNRVNFFTNINYEEGKEDQAKNFPNFMNDPLDEFNSVRFCVDARGHRV